MDLSIIIVNYNTKKVTAGCLRSITNSKDKIKKEVIVIDNGSKDDSINYLKSFFPHYQILSLGGNLGFAQGNNFGVNQAVGDYVWLLNSDTLLKPNTISTLMKQVKINNSQVASCCLLNHDSTIQPQGGFLPRLSRLAAWMLFIDDLPVIKHLLKPYHQNLPDFFKHDQHPGWLAGTALLVKRQLYNQLGGLDKNIFMYTEDVEFCLRLAKQGIRLDYFSTPKLTHLGQASGSSQGAVLGEYKGLKYIYLKHKAGWEYPMLRLLLKIGAWLRIIIFGIILKDATKKQIYQAAFKLA